MDDLHHLKLRFTQRMSEGGVWQGFGERGAGNEGEERRLEIVGVVEVSKEQRVVRQDV